LETKIRNFLSGGVNLSVVISVDFVPKDLLGRLDLGDIFSDAGSNQMILEPTIGAFDLPFGLGRKGISDLHIAVIENLFPLRGGFIGEEVMFSPDGVSSLDKSEDGMGIDIVAIGESMLKNDGLEGQDMGPACFLVDQGCVEDKSAVIIQGCDEIPFLLGRRCP
jgi:hypothetical protein